MRQTRLTPQAIKDVASFDAGTRDKIKDAIRHLAEPRRQTAEGQISKRQGVGYRGWPYRIPYRKTGTERLDILATEHRKAVYR